MPLEPLYVAVEFVSGGSLDKLLRKSRVQKCREQEQPPYANIWSRLTERQLLQIASDIANGMKYLESKLVSHAQPIQFHRVLTEDLLLFELNERTNERTKE